MWFLNTLERPAARDQPVRFLFSLHLLNPLQHVIHFESFPAKANSTTWEKSSAQAMHLQLHQLGSTHVTWHRKYERCQIRVRTTKRYVLPFGICSSVSVSHEGQCPVQKYGLKQNHMLINHYWTQMMSMVCQQRESTDLLLSGSLCGEIYIFELALKIQTPNS